jgi:hypothetical protein
MLMLLVLALGLADTPSIQVHPARERGRVEVIATLAGRLLEEVPEGALRQAQGERWLRFCLLDRDSGAEGPAILGTYRREQAKLIFVPRHPLTPEQRYRAILELGGGRTVKAEHRAAAVPESRPAVEKVYPSGDVLPANLLKFYLHFSKPMRESKAIFDQIELRDEKGKPVSEPWRRTELWNADSTRLTLWIHPGRIKRGVGLREDEGPVLLPDRKYTLVIGAEVADVGDRTLGKAFTKTFRTTADLRKRPLPEEWTLRAPLQGTTQPLRVEFGAPIDRAQLDRFLTVKDSRGGAVAGRVEAGKDERSWLFHPTKRWESDKYTLTVDDQLEDIAGNTPRRLFDVDLKEAPPAPPKLTLSFRPQ